MDIPLDKAIPRALAAAVVVYCLWPSLSAFFSDPTSKPPKKTPELTAALLSPELPPPSSRDPFKKAGSAIVSAEKPAATAPEKSSQPKKSSQASSIAKKPVDARRSLTTMSRSSNGNISVKSRSDSLPQKDPVLEATSIVGDHRVAIINGRIYAPKDKISFPSASVMPCEIVEVQPYKVVLKCANDKIVTLTYPNTSTTKSSSPRSTRSAKPKSTKTRKTKTGTTKKKR